MLARPLCVTQLHGLSMLSDPWHDWVDLARQLAHDFKHPEFQHQIVALGVRHGRAIGYGVNQQRHARGISVFKDSLHAEADLIRRCGDSLDGTKVYLYRFNNAENSPYTDKPMCARPCLLCSHLLKQTGVKQVIFCDHQGTVQSLKRSELSFLKEDPSVLTKLFVDRVGEMHRNFLAERHLATG